MTEDPESSERFDAILEAALALPKRSREALLQRECLGDAELLSQLRRVLARHEALGSFIEPSSETARLRPGERIAGGVVDRLVHRGPGGEVYRWQDDAGEVSALKVCDADDPGFVERVDRVRRVAHPGLVPVHACGIDDARRLAWIVMAFVAGESLDDFLEDASRRTESWSGGEQATIVGYAAQIADALAALHRAGIVHRDVKPANVILAGDGTQRRTVLVDLANARSTSASGSSTVYATPAYAAPETLLGHAPHPADDVFSLGVMLHDLLARRSPPQRERRPTTGAVPLRRLVPELSPDLEAIVAQATAIDQHRRYADADSLAADLRAWLAGREVSARPRGWWRRVRQRALRSQRPRLWTTSLWMAVGALVVLAAVGVVSLAATVARVAACRDLWQRGELIAADRLASELPGPLRAASMPAALLASGPVRDVLDCARVSGVATAAERAAVHIGLRGWRQQPDLVRWFASTPATHARCLARLLLEAPAADRRDLEAQAGLRRALLGVGANADAEIVAALGGCGDGTTVPFVTGIVRRACADERIELARVGLMALARIFARTLRFGDRQAFDSIAAAALREVADAVRHLRDAQPEPARRLAQLVESSFVLWASMRRADGREAPPAAVLEVCSARRSRSLVMTGGWNLLQRVQAGLPPFAAGEVIEGGWASRTTYHWTGLLVGLSGEEQAAFETAIVGLSAQHGLDGEGCLASFARGRGVGREWVAGMPPDWSVDAGTRLADVEVRRGERPRPLALQPDGAGVAGVSLDLTASPVLASGDVRSSTTLAATWASDEIGDGRFLRLDVPGVSTLRLRFRLAAAAEPLAQLRIDAQKALRGALPQGGRAGLIVCLDEAPLHTIADLMASSRQQIVLPLLRDPTSTEHELELRLHPDANTTLRLLGVTVERPAR